MPQIVLKEGTAHLASYTFFTRDIDQFQFYEPPRTLFSHRTRIISCFRLVKIAKFLRTAF